MYRQQHHHQQSSGSAWNAGRSIGPKRALKPQEVWEIRFHLEHEKRVRDRAMFDVAIDSKLRGCHHWWAGSPALYGHSAEDGHTCIVRDRRDRS
jgi:hypothetical protein